MGVSMGYFSMFSLRISRVLWLLVSLFSVQQLWAQPSLEKIIQTCKQNKNFEACFVAGAAYENAQWGVAKNMKQANYYYQIACYGNHHKACFNLGNNYIFAKGLPENITVEEKNTYVHKGLTLMKKSCNIGNHRACMQYGGSIIRFANGAKSAVTAYEKACDLGFSEGCLAAAKIYQSGAGKGDGIVQKDIKKVAMLKQKSAVIVQTDTIMNDIVTHADKKVFTKMSYENGVIKYQMNNMQTRWEAKRKDNTLLLTHIMTGFPDTPAFRTLVKEQNKALDSRFYIEKFPNKNEEYFAIANSFILDNKNNYANFKKFALQGLTDINHFMNRYQEIIKKQSSNKTK